MGSGCTKLFKPDISVKSPKRSKNEAISIIRMHVTPK